ncbi:MAG: YbdD/YjiX family protein [Alphaproteobacteria bacterium]|nr:YbdD/YjiX family protein [Alphaproteobacteria bacterium]
MTLRALWQNVKKLVALYNGDSAYDDYRQHLASHHPHAVPMSRREFFHTRQQERWSRINRCC